MDPVVSSLAHDLQTEKQRRKLLADLRAGEWNVITAVSPCIATAQRAHGPSEIKYTLDAAIAASCGRTLALVLLPQSFSGSGEVASLRSYGLHVGSWSPGHAWIVTNASNIYNDAKFHHMPVASGIPRG